MKQYKVQKTILCEVRVWGWITADGMFDAMTKGLQGDTGDRDYDHEIIRDIKTISVEIEEETK